MTDDTSSSDKSPAGENGRAEENRPAGEDRPVEERCPAALGREPELPERLLFAQALAAAGNAYAPYSGFRVGAVAVDGSSGEHHGVNVENAAYPAGLCAERAALAALVAAGEREVRTVAVAAAGGVDCLPCGLCLQALSEFGDPDVIVRAGGQMRAFRLHELLATPFALPKEGVDGQG